MIITKPDQADGFQHGSLRSKLMTQTEEIMAWQINSEATT
jgi:hypothetical protein